MKQWLMWVFCSFTVVAFREQCASPAFAEEVSPVSLEIMRTQSTCESGLKKLDADNENANASLQSQYVKWLNGLEKKVREAGNLEPLIAVRKERERFTSEKQVLGKDLSGDIPDLRGIQDNYLKALAKLSVDHAKGVISLVQQLDRSLGALQEKCTKSGKIEDALDVQKARESLKDQRKVAEANFIVAEAEAAKPDEEQPGQSAADAKTNAIPTGSKPEKAEAAPKKKYSGSIENYVRQRYSRLCKAMLKDDWNAATEFVDPAYAKTAGADAVRQQLRRRFSFLRSVQANSRARLDAGDVRIGDREETATVVPRIWSNNRWHDQPLTYWLQLDGEWYADMKTGSPPGGTSTSDLPRGVSR